MIQVNLIPDLKAEFLKAQRTKRFMFGISVLVSSAALGLVSLMFLYVNVWQQEHTNNLNADIQKLTVEYQNKTDLDKVVTVQNQLSSLPDLHLQKPLISRLVTYLSVITPKGPEYSAVNVNLETMEIELAGSASDPAQVNKLANTVKNAVYTVDGDEETKVNPFTNVILDTITNDEDIVKFSMKFTFDDQIFNNHGSVKLVIPEIDSTNSEVNRPDVTVDIFNDNNEEDGDGE